MKTRKRPSDIEIRLWRGDEQLQQANTIYSFVGVIFQFSQLVYPNDDWRDRLEAMAHVSQFVEFTDPSGRDESILDRAMREIATRRLPRLLCVALVSTFEAILEDVTVLAVLRAGEVADEAIARQRVRDAMRGTVREYIPRLAALANEPRLAELNWESFAELVAARNLLVHQPTLVADARYVRQGGPAARAVEGQELRFDHGDFMAGYATTLSLVHEMIKIFAPASVAGQPPDRQVGRRTRKRARNRRPSIP